MSADRAEKTDRSDRKREMEDRRISKDEASVPFEDCSDAGEQICIRQLDVISPGGPVADFAEFVAILEPEGDLFGGGVFEVDGEAFGGMVRVDGVWIRGAGEDVAASIY